MKIPDMLLFFPSGNHQMVVFRRKAGEEIDGKTAQSGRAEVKSPE